MRRASMGRILGMGAALAAVLLTAVTLAPAPVAAQEVNATITGTYEAYSTYRCLHSAAGVTVTSNGKSVDIIRVCLDASGAGLLVQFAADTTQSEYTEWRGTNPSPVFAWAGPSNALYGEILLPALQTLKGDRTNIIGQTFSNAIFDIVGETSKNRLMSSAQIQAFNALSAGASGSVTITMNPPTTTTWGNLGTDTIRCIVPSALRASNNTIAPTLACYDISRSDNDFQPIYLLIPEAEEDKYDAFRAGTAISGISMRLANTTAGADVWFEAGLATLPSALSSAQAPFLLKRLDLNTNAACSGSCGSNKMGGTFPGDAGTVTVTVTPPASSNPPTPANLTAQHNTDYTDRTLGWEQFVYTAEYSIRRDTLVESTGGVGVPIYADTEYSTLAGTPEGVSTYTDSGVDAGKTYRYGIAAKGPGGDGLSGYAEIVSIGQEEVNVAAPQRLSLTRNDAATGSIMLSWGAPVGEVTGYTVERRTLSQVGTDSLFEGQIVISPAGSDWLPANDTTYNDTTIFTSRTYDYRVAGVQDGVVGAFTEWARSTPINTSLGEAPENVRIIDRAVTVERGAGELVVTPPVLLGDRAEFWLGWDEVPGVTGYEVARLSRPPAGGVRTAAAQSTPALYLSMWTQESLWLRVRGYLVSEDQCSDAPANTCYTEWSGTVPFIFTPDPTAVVGVPAIDPTDDPLVEQLRADLGELVAAGAAPWGAPVEYQSVASLATLVMAVAVFVLAYTTGRGGGDSGVALGVAMGGVMLVLFIGWYLFGAPVAWLVGYIAAQALMGVFCIGRSLRIF